MFNSLFSKTSKKQSITASDTNRITVRVWSRKHIGAADAVGHASLQTYTGSLTNKGIYASFWPGDIGDKKIGGDGRALFSRSGVAGANLSLADDKKEEGREPDFVVHLYGLDIEKINTAHNKFVTSKSNWSALGSSFIGSPETQNCAGLVMYLLNEGGLETIYQTYAKFSESWAGRTMGTFGGYVSFTSVFSPISSMFVGLPSAPPLVAIFEILQTYVLRSAALQGYALHAFIPTMRLLFNLYVPAYTATILGTYAITLATKRVGRKFGKAVGITADTPLEVGAIITPDGIAALAVTALRAEQAMYHFTGDLLHNIVLDEKIQPKKSYCPIM